MSLPASAQPLHHHMPARLAMPVRAPPQGEELPFLPQLDLLWHYDCVVSPRSHASSRAKLERDTTSPLSPASKLPPASRSPTSDHRADISLPPPQVSSSSHAAFSPSSHSKSPVCQVNDSNEIHQRRAVAQSVFNTFDEDGDGTVSIHEISRIFEKLGIDYSMESLLANLVTKSPGHVDEQEFVSLYESVCSADPSASSSSLQADVDQDLLAAFHVFDKDGNGYISPAELQSVLCSLGFPQGRQLDACVDMIARVDENGDGHVDFFEFKKLFLVENPFLMITSY